MDFNVRFRINKHTGQVYVFEVDHEGPRTLDDSEHNRRHEQVAADIARQIERLPRIDAVPHGVLPEPDVQRDDTAEADTQVETDPEKQKE